MTGVIYYSHREGVTKTELFDRISYVIEKSGLTKTEFAKRINISQPHLSKISAGVSNPSDRTITDICREFKVDEIWLRTGDGEPFRQESRNEQIAAFAGDLMTDEPDSFRKAFVSAMSELSLEDWKVLERLARLIVEKADNQE